MTRSGPTRLRMRISAPPAAGPARGQWAAIGPEELRDLDVIQSGLTGTDVDMPVTLTQ